MAWDGSLSASETVTASGNGASLAIGPTGVFEVEVETSGVSGTSPTLDLKFQESDDDSTYNDILSLPQITGAFKDQYFLKSEKRYVRYVKTVGGTSPSFDLDVRIK